MYFISTLLFGCPYFAQLSSCVHSHFLGYLKSIWCHFLYLSLPQSSKVMLLFLLNSWNLFSPFNFVCHNSVCLALLFTSLASPWSSMIAKEQKTQDADKTQNTFSRTDKLDPELASIHSLPSASIRTTTFIDHCSWEVRLLTETQQWERWWQQNPLSPSFLISLKHPPLHYTLKHEESLAPSPTQVNVSWFFFYRQH